MKLAMSAVNDQSNDFYSPISYSQHTAFSGTHKQTIYGEVPVFWQLKAFQRA